MKRVTMKSAITQRLPGLLLAMLLGLAPLFASQALAQDMAPINVNSADAELLAELPGIGATRATAIVEDRDANGPYGSAEDLTRVSGIGEATVEGFADQVTF